MAYQATKAGSAPAACAPELASAASAKAWGWGEGEARKRTESQHGHRPEYAPVKTPTRFLFRISLAGIGSCRFLTAESGFNGGKSKGYGFDCMKGMAVKNLRDL